MKKKNLEKVICIGFHKTGTTSLSDAMEMIGFPISHGSEIFHHVSGNRYDRKLMGHIEESNPFREKLLTALCEGIDNSHGIQDSPCVFFYKDLAQKYPNAKFMFTTRDENAWFGSLKAFVRDKSNPLRQYMYNVPKITGNEAVLMDAYRKYTREILSYFEDHPNFRSFDITKGELNWENLLEFLGEDFYPDVEHAAALLMPFPRSNISQST